MKAGPALTCRDERRRHRVRSDKRWNGLDYLEVGADQRSLTVFFLDKAPAGLRPENISIRPCGGGGGAVRVVGMRLCVLEDEERDDCLHLTLDRPGGFSPYRLCLVALDERGRPTDRPLPGFDRRYACLEFSFKVDCRSNLDCKDERACPPERRTEPEINYLAKDYASFRQLLFDRLAVTMPDWRERHVPDLGVALVELLAYVGDHLSYYQDAVATEAYLDTARRRISVRRHVRLVDYPMHEGCNARAWVFVEASSDHDFGAQDFYCITGFEPSPPAGKPLTADDLRDVPGERYLVFEPVAAAGAIKLRAAHNRIGLYGWGDRECCLPRGATRATLVDEWVVPPVEEPSPEYPHGPEDPKYPNDPKAPSYQKDPNGPRLSKEPKHDDGHGSSDESCDPPPRPEPKRLLDLRAGDLLLFEEVLGAKTLNPADADATHRHVVRLTRVEPGVDELYRRSKQPPGLPIVEIEWAQEDALPFPLCLSALGGPRCEVKEVSVARGNLFLADHGRRVEEELEAEPEQSPELRCVAEGRLADAAQLPARFKQRPLQLGPLTFRQPLPARARRVPASRLLTQEPRRAEPEVDLTEPTPFAGLDWSVRRDLLASGPDDRHFVAEVDDDGRAWLRFGDGELGFAPLAGTELTAVYRVGNGPAGNVGAGAIRHLVLRNYSLSGVLLTPRNPLPARGGTAPEPLADVRLLAPCAFRAEAQRAITAEDYARLVERDFSGRVQRAAATLRWTGSWTEVLVAVDPRSTETNVDRLLQEIRSALHRYRRIGHDVVVRRAVPVPLRIELQVCVLPHFLRGHVEAALLEVLGNRQLQDGRRGFFHADNLTFGQGIPLSRLLADAQAVTGVESVEARVFERLFEGPKGELQNGFLPLGPLEIARLDNDPRFPDGGHLRLRMGGGR